MSVCLNMCMFVCLNMCMFVCLNVCMFVCLNVCMFVCLNDYVCLWNEILCSIRWRKMQVWNVITLSINILLSTQSPAAVWIRRSGNLRQSKETKPSFKPNLTIEFRFSIKLSVNILDFYEFRFKIQNIHRLSIKIVL